MPILLARIDDRLVHGQVAVGWARALSADAVVVAEDGAAEDTLAQALMRMAAPPGVSVSVLRVEEAARSDRAGRFAARRVILLFARPADVLRFLEGGGTLSSVNVGGMRFADGKRQVLPAVAVDDADCVQLRAIASRGIELECRIVPTDRRLDFLALLAPARGGEGRESGGAT